MNSRGDGGTSSVEILTTDGQAMRQSIIYLVSLLLRVPFSLNDQLSKRVTNSKATSSIEKILNRIYLEKRNHLRNAKTKKNYST